MLLSKKIFLRLSVFFVLYFTYLVSFSYLSQVEYEEIPHEFGIQQRDVVSFEDKICTNNADVDAIMQDYLPLQNKNLDSIKTTGKFIVFSAIDDAGLGNRIPTLVSCFLLSLLTNRGFMVHWPSIEESVNDQGEHIGMSAFEDLFRSPFFMDSTLHQDFFDSVSPETTEIVSVESLSNVLLCGDFEKEYQNTRIIIIYGWRPFFDVLLRNKHYLDRVNELNLTSLVHDISRCLLQPVPLVNEIIDRFRQQSNIGPHNKIVGIHIRKQSSHGLSSEQEMALWDCIRARHPPPPAVYVEGYSNWNASILYFLASDSPSTVLNVPPDFRPYIVMVRQTDSSRTTVEGLAHALADMWLLGQTVELFGGQGTTFLAAVRTLFGVHTQLVSWKSLSVPPSQNNQTTNSSSGNLTEISAPVMIDARCVTLNVLPCYKWWDVFREVHNFSLSCYITQSGTSPKDSYLC